MFPDSKHNNEEDGIPQSEAFDLAPYPTDWGALQQFEKFLKGEAEFSAAGFHAYRRFDHLAGYLRGLAGALNYKLIWGGDWDNDFIMNDQKFHDLGHFELEE